MPYTVGVKKNFLSHLLSSSEMVRRTRDLDWSRTPVGPIEKWSNSLTNTVGIVLQSGMPMCLAWGDQYTQFYNDAYRPILGTGVLHPKALGTSVQETWPEIWPTIGPMWETVKKTGEAYASDNFKLILERNGHQEECYFVYSYSAVRDDDGSIQGVLVTCAETTQRVLAEQRLKEEHLELYNFLMEAPVGSAVLEGPQHVFRLVNPLYLSLLFPGKTAADFLGKSVQDVIPEVRNQGFIDILDNVYNTGVPFTAKKMPIALYQNNELRHLYVNFTYRPKFNEHGKINGIIAVIVEVTDEVREKDELEKVLNKFNTVVENLGEGLIIFDPDGTIQSFNPEGLKLHGYRSIHDVKTEKDVEDYFELFEDGKKLPMSMWPHTRILRGEKLTGLELEMHREGKISYFSYNGTPIVNPDGSISLAVLTIRDVTKKRESLRIMNREKQKFEAIFFDSPAAMALLRGPEFNFEKVNQKFIEIMGNRSLQDKPLLEALPEMKGQSFYELMKGVFYTGSPFIGNEILVKIKPKSDSDQEDMYLDFSYSRLDDGEGKPYGVYIHAIDITEKVLARKKIEEALKARDEFISIASHELKTPLTSLKLQAQIQRRLIQKNDPKAYEEKRIATFSEATDAQITKLNRLVDDMLDISRIKTGKLTINPDIVDLSKLILNVIDDMRSLFSANNFPMMNLNQEIIGTWDALRIEQVIANLLTNAIRYGMDRPVAIEAKKENGLAIIKVQDQGMGIDELHFTRIFDRFERINAKEISGLGLGLFLTKQIVEAHNGKIFVESVLGKGSVFTVELPVNQIFPPGNPLAAYER